MHNFLYQVVAIFPILMLITKRIDIFLSRSISAIWTKKNWTQRFLEYTKFSCIVFCTKMFRNIFFISKTSYYLTNPILFHYYWFFYSRISTIKIWKEFFLIQLAFFLLSNFILLFINQRLFHLFLFVFLYTPVPPSCWMPCYKH